MNDRYTGAVIASEICESAIGAWEDWLTKFAEVIRSTPTKPERLRWRKIPELMEDREFDQRVVAYRVVARIVMLDNF